jgi:hypothetical protein
MIDKGFSGSEQVFCKINMDADKSLAFPVFPFAAQPKEFFLNGLNKIEQRSHKCV